MRSKQTASCLALLPIFSTATTICLFYFRGSIKKLKLNIYLCCCRTSTQTCSLNNTESAFELPIIWDPYYKNKITIRAITRYVTSGSSYFSYAVYEASFDIQVNQTSIVPNNLINLTYLRSYIGSPENGTYLDFCNNL